MKNKKIKMIVSFLLALVLLVSLPLDIQANAVALEGWILYAVITYLAAMGITFTVAGGVDAMVQAMEEKVKDYETQNNIIDFYDHFRNNNVRLVPSGGSDPDGNPFFDLFFTAGAVEAIQSFASWLVNNGWGLGSNYPIEVNDIQFFTSEGTKILSDSSVLYNGSPVTESIYTLGDTFTYDELMSISILTDAGNMSFKQGETDYKLDIYIDGNYKMTVTSKYTVSSFAPYTFAIHHNYGTASDIVIILGRISESPGASYPYKGSVLYSANYNVGGVDYRYEYIYTDISATVDIITPEELQEQFPSVDQGVSIKDAISVPMNDPSLDDWARLVQDTFEDIGTIPQPVPQVVPNPDYAPTVTPVPTPEPSPEIEDVDDLGLPMLGEAIKNKFPFCLPSDLKELIEILTAEPVTPNWKVDLFKKFPVKLNGSTEIGIDLSNYEELGVISRWASVITYCIFLLVITKGMIGW